ncbi:MAG: pyridoxal phosphate-dependent aminotransferase, partial [Phycisphaerales bacterium]
PSLHPPMQLSPRVAALRPSATLAVNARARELKSKGVDVLTFAAGEPDFDTPQVIKDAVAAALARGETKYAPVPGDPETRRIIAEKLTRENGIPNCTAEHVVVSAGGKQALYNLFQCLVQPGDEVLIPVPAWVSFAPQVDLAGGKVVEVLTGAANDFKMSPAQLRAAITPRSKVLVINSPSNPCGTMYTPDEIRALAEVVEEAARSVAPNLVVISDEMYEKILFGGIPHFSIGSVPAIAERVVTCNALSKTYAMTGWRIGYCAGSGAFGLKLSKALQALQGHSTTSIPTFLFPAVRVALTQCDADVERMRVAFAARAALTFELGGKILGLVCPRPTGAFYVFPDVSAHFGKFSQGGKPINSAMDFAAALLDEHHVAVVPGEDFGTGGEKCIRITFACSEETIRQGVTRLAEFVAGLR